MDKRALITQMISKTLPHKKQAMAYAPANVALIKYWGKSNTQLNLPMTDSLSLSLGHMGTMMQVSHNDNSNADCLIINESTIERHSIMYKRITEFLDLIRPENNFYFNIVSKSTVPIACGLASSASAYAALSLALNEFFQWDLSKQQLSQLARYGSGSACRSLWKGFVYWSKGISDDGTDSYASPMGIEWDDIRIGIVKAGYEKKKVSSREAMLITQKTSYFYSLWPKLVKEHVCKMKLALEQKNFSLLGAVTEENSLAMHALMLNSNPSIVYSNANTLVAMNKIWSLRQQGLPIYFTQDAGPQLKILFCKNDSKEVSSNFKTLEVVNPF